MEEVLAVHELGFKFIGRWINAFLMWVVTTGGNIQTEKNIEFLRTIFAWRLTICI